MYPEYASISSNYVFITIRCCCIFQNVFIIFVGSFPSLFLCFEMIYEGTFFNNTLNFISFVCYKLHLFFVIDPFLRLFILSYIWFAWIGWWSDRFLLRALFLGRNEGMTGALSEFSRLSFKRFFIILLISCSLIL